MDYQNGKIYKLVCSETQQIYIGSTCQPLFKRKYGHKTQIKKKCSKQNVSYKDFIEPEIFLVEDFPCERKEQLLARERHHIENTDCVNIEIPRSKKESSQVSFEKNKHKYREGYRQRAAKYYEDNKEEIKKKWKEKMTCECGVIINKSSYTNHIKTKKHQNFKR